MCIGTLLHLVGAIFRIFNGFVFRCLTWCLLLGCRLGFLGMLEVLRTFLCT
jgi:hypothetical protein